MNYWTQSEKNIWVAAHRGWLDKYPENTMEAFIAAEKLGVDQIETDVRITKDKQLFAIETNTLPGMTPTSILPAEAASVGITYSQLIDLIIDKSLYIKR
jgi:glycerophosphoryl diester phosphodiesterase